MTAVNILCVFYRSCSFCVYKSPSHLLKLMFTNRKRSKASPVTIFYPQIPELVSRSCSNGVPTTAWLQRGNLSQPRRPEGPKSGCRPGWFLRRPGGRGSSRLPPSSFWRGIGQLCCSLVSAAPPRPLPLSSRDKQLVHISGSKFPFL